MHITYYIQKKPEDKFHQHNIHLISYSQKALGAGETRPPFLYNL